MCITKTTNGSVRLVSGRFGCRNPQSRTSNGSVDPYLDPSKTSPSCVYSECGYRAEKGTRDGETDSNNSCVHFADQVDKIFIVKDLHREYIDCEPIRHTSTLEDRRVCVGLKPSPKRISRNCTWPTPRNATTKISIVRTSHRSRRRQHGHTAATRKKQ